MALGIRYLKETTETQHNWVALVPENFVHQKFISDLAGYDPLPHNEKAETVIPAVAAWLSIQPDFTLPTPSAKMILNAYPGFCELLDQARADALGTLTWPAILKCAQGMVAGLET